MKSFHLGMTIGAMISALGSSFKAKVRFNQRGFSTDSHWLNVPGSPLATCVKWVAVVLGGAYHEIAHLLYTDFDVPTWYTCRFPQKVVHEIAHGVEDPRVEYRLIQDFPGARISFMEAEKESMASNGLRHADGNDLVGAATLYGIYRKGEQLFPERNMTEYYESARAVLLEKFGEKILSQVDQAYDAFDVGTTETKDAYAFAENLLDLLQIPQEQQKESDENQDSDEQGDSKQSDQQTEDESEKSEKSDGSGESDESEKSDESGEGQNSDNDSADSGDQDSDENQEEGDSSDQGKSGSSDGSGNKDDQDNNDPANGSGSDENQDDSGEDSSSEGSDENQDSNDEDGKDDSNKDTSGKDGDNQDSDENQDQDNSDSDSEGEKEDQAGNDFDPSEAQQQLQEEMNSKQNETASFNDEDNRFNTVVESMPNDTNADGTGGKGASGTDRDSFPEHVEIEPTGEPKHNFSSQACMMRDDLTSLLTAKADHHEVCGLDDGDLDLDALPFLVAGESNIFSEDTAENDDGTTLIGIMLDLSGSMTYDGGKRYRVQAEAASLLLEALDGIPNVETYMIGMHASQESYDHIIIKRPGDDVMLAQKKIAALPCRGGTPLVMSTLSLCNDLLEQSDFDNHVGMVITDGGYPSCYRPQFEMMETSVDLFGIGIAADLSNLFTNHVNINHVDDLPSTLVDLMTQYFESER